MLKDRGARKAQDKADKAALEAQRQQRVWDVEDRDKKRGFDLEDRASRQALLNPYAAYFKGERLAKPASPAAAALPEPVQGRQYGDTDFNDQRFGMQRR